jgi:RNA polymerase sigma-70 factor (ECF subfamily)
MFGCHLDWVPTREFPPRGGRRLRAPRPRWVPVRPGEDRPPVPNARQLLADSNAFDAQLMARVRGRDPHALRALYDRHSSMVYGLALKILRDATEAEDLAQDVFLALWRQADRFDAERGVFLGWLVSLTRNRAIDRLRSRKTRDAKTDAFEVEAKSDPAPAGADPNEAAYAGELRRAVAAALGGLPEAQRTALELAYFGGLSHSEIAERLETPLGTIKARIRQGMMRMRDALGDFASAAALTDQGE